MEVKPDIAEEPLQAMVSQEALGVESEPTDEAIIIDRPFDPGKIKVTTEQKGIDLIVRRIDHGEVDLAPEFQRRARVWHPHRKSKLIESLLLRIPLPVFYVAANQKDDWSVVDGLQRLTTIYDFVKGEFRLSGLEYLGILDGKCFSDLDRPMQRRIEETELVVNVIQPGTPEEVMINIFKRINTGGVPLTGQEIRNALNKGPVRAYLRSLAESAEFKAATDNTVRDDRMDAQEMVLRYLAFRLVPPEEYRVNDLDTFLNDAMSRLNAMSSEQRNLHANEFTRAMIAARSIFDKTAFRKPKVHSEPGVQQGRNPVSKPLFEAWAIALTNLSDDALARLVERKDAVQAAMLRLMEKDSEFVISVSYSTGVPGRVLKRFSAVKSAVDLVLRQGRIF
jgi:hypothetical protein